MGHKTQSDNGLKDGNAMAFGYATAQQIDAARDRANMHNTYD
mgnify:CR=1 FL=1